MPKLILTLTIFTMIIGIDGSRAFIRQRTGTENYSYQLILHLAKIDKKNLYKIYIKQDTKKFIDPNLFPSNFHFIPINFKRLWTQAGLAIKTFTDPLDILFIPSHTLPLIKHPRLKTVVTVHDLGAEYLPHLHQLKQRIYLKAMTHYQLHQATHIIAVSKATKSDLIKKVALSPSAITTIYEGIDTTFFKPKSFKESQKILQKYSLQPNSYFFFVGTIQPRKNLANLIRGYANFLTTTNASKVQLVLGGGKGWLSEDIYLLPKQLGIEDKVKFIGRVDDQDLPSLYSHALALTYPSLFEGFGLPILEAYSCHCPVLTSNCSSMPEVAGNAAILVDPLDVNQISQGLQQLFTDKRLIENNIKKGIKQLKKFSWEKSAKQTLSLLETVATKT